MPLEVVPADQARALRRPKGVTITLVNASAVDVYFDEDPNRLNASAPGAVPNGTKLAATTGQIQFSVFPGVLYVRAATQTQIDVHP